MSNYSTTNHNGATDWQPARRPYPYQTVGTYVPNQVIQQSNFYAESQTVIPPYAQSIQQQAILQQRYQPPGPTALLSPDELKQLYSEIEKASAKIIEPNPFAIRSFNVSNPFPKMHVFRKKLPMIHNPS